ncbi:cytosolic purine 5'-nucleotidase isoform X3 [Vespula squamosa]|uniref:Cytosolic purine 5'-nucleotidase isoform X3 n=1 Tax=Vespula squamosa TaxID=30214 RepID=A0ABD2A6Y9_VESSQ
MSTTDAWKFAKIAKYGLLPRILAFGQRRTDGLHTALRTNSSSVASMGQSDPRLIRASTIRQKGKVCQRARYFCFLTFLQLIMEVENCNSHGDHGNVSPSTPQNDNDPTGHKKWYRQASQR